MSGSTEPSRSMAAAPDAWSQALEVSPDVAYLIAPDNIILDVNPQTCRVLRSSREKLIGTKILTHLERDSAVIAERVLREIVQRRSPERSTRVFLVAGHEPQTFEVIECPLVRDGKVWAVAGFGREISQEVLLERKLWDTVESRQSALDFALRTSLGLVKGYVYTLGQNHAMDDSRRTRYVQIIEEEIDHLSKIIEDLLDVRRMESGEYERNDEIVDIAECANLAIRQIEAEAAHREIRIDARIPSDAVPFFAPREALVRVMLNLVQNAIHHTMHSGEVAIEIVDHDAYVELVVRDNGVGIPETEMPFIFDKYFRGKSSAASPVPGTGLGLPIARILVEAMGGRIFVGSKLGSGSEFRVVLPRRPVHSGDVGEAEFWKLSAARPAAAAAI